MSYTKIQSTLESQKNTYLKETMIKAQIPGLSIAYVRGNEKIITQEIGVTNGCGLFKVRIDPTKCKFYELGIGTKDTILSFNNELFFANNVTKSVTKIILTKENQAAYQDLIKKCTSTYKLAEDNEHPLIKALVSEYVAPKKVENDSRFGAASLSKPVFAYLVQKLIQVNTSKQKDTLTKGKFILPLTVEQFDLDTPLSEILPLEDLKIDGMSQFKAINKEEEQAAKTITARMVLSHMSGLEHGEIKFQFTPQRKAHGYSNIGIIYLQKVIEKLTQWNLNDLTKEFVFTPCGMSDSHFGEYATHTLQTSAKDYAQFVKHLLNDKAIENPFIPLVLMTEDSGKAGAIGVAKGNIEEAILKHVAWGLGWGLQIDDNKEAITAYHSGDANDSRAWVAINIKEKSAVVFFANSHNGHILAEQVTSSFNFNLEYAKDYFFPKWGFARNVKELGENLNYFGLKAKSATLETTLTSNVYTEENEKNKSNDIQCSHTVDQNKSDEELSGFSSITP